MFDDGYKQSACSLWNPTAGVRLGRSFIRLKVDRETND